VLVRAAMTGDETPDELIVRLQNEPVQPASREVPAELLYVGAAERLRLGFGPNGGLWEVTSGGHECADPAKRGLGAGVDDGAGLFVGALEDGRLRQVGGDVRAVDGGVALSASLKPQELQIEAQIRDAGGWLEVTGEIRDMRGADRAVDLLFKLPIAPEGWLWHDDILQTQELTLDTAIETEYLLTAVTGTDGSPGVGIALDPELPVGYQIGFDPERYGMYLRLKLGLSPDHKLQGTAPFSFIIAPVDGQWGMRDLLATWYEAFPAAFERRAMKEGSWLFAIPPPQVPNPQDYGYYEGSRDTDFVVEHGIVPCPYVIPGQRSITRLESMPASYEEAMAAFDAYDPSVGTFGPLVKEQIANCRVMTPDGKYPIRIRDDVGADIKPEKPINMVVFSTNCDPDLMADQDAVTIGRSTLETVQRITGNDPRIGGIYVDSGAGWVARYLNIRRDHFPDSDYPLTYDEETGFVGIMGKGSVVEFLRGLGAILHPGGRVVFPNIGCTRRVPWYYAASDVCGLEGRVHDLTSMAYFRSMAYHKPTLRLEYMTVVSRDTAIAGREGMEEYFKNCIAYAVYPSVGRHADRAYEMYQDLYDTYMPPLREIGAAGWEPVPHATVEGSDGPVIERFGPSDAGMYFTIYNPTDEARTVRATVDYEALTVEATAATDLVSGEAVDLSQALEMAAGQLMIVKMTLAAQ